MKGQMMEQSKPSRNRTVFYCSCRDARDESYRHCGCENCRRRRFDERNGMPRNEVSRYEHVDMEISKLM